MSESDDLVSLVADVAQAEQRVDVPAETKTADVTAEEAEYVGDDQDFSRTPWDERPQPEAEVPSKEETETSSEAKKPEEPKTETETNKEEAPAEEAPKEEQPAEDNNDWLKTLPPPPQDLQLKQPEYDEDGNVINMTGPEFMNYVQQATLQATRVDSYNRMFLDRSLQAAEEILPEMKTNENIRKMVQNQVVAATMNGENFTAVDAARSVKSLIGTAKSEGANSAKTSITIQKNAALETPSNQPKPDEKSQADKNLTKRLKSNDKTAYDELLANWIEDGII